MTEAEIITGADLDAYVDNQLDAAGRLRIEQYLAGQPEAAARVMADLSLRGTLKAAMAATDTSDERTDTREAARRLTAHLEGRRNWTTARRVAAVVLLVSAGWFANSPIGPFGAREVNASVHVPPLVDLAIRAHAAEAVRSEMPAQPASTDYDPDAIRAKTAVVMPELPKDWRVADVEIFPSDYGPSVEVRMQTGEGLQLSLFAVRPGYFAVEPVKDLAIDGGEAAWWQIGDVAYAVVSTRPDVRISADAERLKQALY